MNTETGKEEVHAGERKAPKRQQVIRFLIYLAGMVILAIGITLNTKTGLGVSPIISIAYCVSSILDWNFGNTTMGLYCVFVIVQLFLRGKGQRLPVLLQIPVALLVSQLLNVFDYLFRFQADSFWLNLLILIGAVLLTGLGVVMSVDMRLVPNPGDGIVQTIADRSGKSLGLTKNLFDIGCIVFSVTLGLICRGKLIGIGIGTLVAMLGVGRAVALFNLLLWRPMTKAAGLKPEHIVKEKEEE